MISQFSCSYVIKENINRVFMGIISLRVKYKNQTVTCKNHVVRLRHVGSSLSSR